MSTGTYWSWVRWAAVLLVLLTVGMAFSGGRSVNLKELWTAPAGLDAADSARQAYARLRQDFSNAAPTCGPVEPWPELVGSEPTKAFEFTLPEAKGGESPAVVYLQDPITKTVVFATTDSRGCPWVAASGRGFEFSQRAVPSPFPNVHLPEMAEGARVMVVIQDPKTIRPWIYVSDFMAYQRVSTTIWMSLAACSTLLLGAALLATGIEGLLKQRVVTAFVVYVVALLFWLTQNFSMAAAAFDLWPHGPWFPLMQALAVAGVVTGIGFASIEFLQLEGRQRRIYQLGVALCALAFLSSAWFQPGYKVGAGLLAVVALMIMSALFQHLSQSDLPFKFFAMGFCATMLGGGVQAYSVIAGGGTSGYWAIFAFPLGAFTQALFWLIAIVSRSEINRRAQRARLLQDATYDALTGLYNRKQLALKVQDCIKRHAQGESTGSALLFLDLDRFKLVNDTLGHVVGDELLKVVSRRLSAVLPKGSMLARFGGDEFLLLIPDCSRAQDASAIAQSLLGAIGIPMPLAGRELRMGASVGLVMFGATYERVDDVVRDADTALHMAKRGGRNRAVVFEPHMRDAIEQRFKVESDLTQGLNERQFELFFQPIVELAGLTHAGFEALVRWKHPVQGYVNPAQFVEIAEDSGQIRELGRQILDMAMQAIGDWKRQGLWQTGWYVSINVSGGQLVDDGLTHELADLQQRHGVACEDIRLELTETAVISNLEAANRIFPAIRGRGIALCMDDFGTGLSSLSYLSDLPFNVLKIDKSFIDDMVTRPEQQALVRAVLSMARELGMLVVAEGLEHIEQVELLQGMQCGYGQGYHFSKPMPMDAATQWLTLRRPV